MSSSENRTSLTLSLTLPLPISWAADADADAGGDVNVQTGTFEKVISVLQNIGYLMSFVYLVRVYYYFWTKGVYTLQKKNLLSLCVNLSAVYSLLIVDMFVKIPNFLVIISCCEVTTTVLLFVMSVDTCVNLRRRARNVATAASAGSAVATPLAIDDEARDCVFFLFYTFCSWILAQSVAYTLAYLYDNFLLILVDFHLIAYTAILVMFFVSLYNIRPAATVNLGAGAGGRRNFTIFGRTLIITLVTSSIKFTFAVIFYATGKQIDWLLFLDCLMAYDGVFIYHCLTFNNSSSSSSSSSNSNHNNKRPPPATGSRLHGGASQVQVHAITNNNALQNSDRCDNHNHHHHHHHLHNNNNCNRNHNRNGDGDVRFLRT